MVVVAERDGQLAVNDPNGSWTNEKQRLYERLVEKDFELVDEQIRAIREQATLLEKLTIRAEDLARGGMEKWMQTHNDFIKQAQQKDATYATREDTGRADKRLEILELYKSKQEGQLGTISAVWGIGSVLLSIAVSIAVRMLFK